MASLSSVGMMRMRMMSNLTDHAQRELDRIYTGGDDEMQTVSGIIKLLQVFSDMGHSGGSASVVIPWINELLQFHNLTPLTDDPKEWQGVWDHVYQSTRRGEAFSNDGGKTYYLLSERKKRNWRGKRTRKVMHRSIAA